MAGKDEFCRIFKICMLIVKKDIYRKWKNHKSSMSKYNDKNFQTFKQKYDSVAFIISIYTNAMINQRIL